MKSSSRSASGFEVDVFLAGVDAGSGVEAGALPVLRVSTIKSGNAETTQNPGVRRDRSGESGKSDKMPVGKRAVGSSHKQGKKPNKQVRERPPLLDIGILCMEWVIFIQSISVSACSTSEASSSFDTLTRFGRMSANPKVMSMCLDNPAPKAQQPSECCLSQWRGEVIDIKAAPASFRIKDIISLSSCCAGWSWTRMCQDTESFTVWHAAGTFRMLLHLQIMMPLSLTREGEMGETRGFVFRTG